MLLLREVLFTHSFSLEAVEEQLKEERELKHLEDKILIYNNVLGFFLCSCSLNFSPPLSLSLSLPTHLPIFLLKTGFTCLR